MTALFEVTRSAAEAMERAAARAGEREACGFVFATGAPAVFSVFVELDNVESPERGRFAFGVDERQVQIAFNARADTAGGLVAIFHSHVDAPASPSAGDRELLVTWAFHFIYGQGVLGLWNVMGGEWRPLEYDLVDG